MDHGHRFGSLFQGGLDPIQIKWHAPVEPHWHTLAISFADLSESLAEFAVGYGNYLILMTDDAGYGRIHAQRSAAGHYRDLVLGLEELLEQFGALAVNGSELAASMADHGLGHGAQHSWRDLDRPWNHEQSILYIHLIPS